MTPIGASNVVKIKHQLCLLKSCTSTYMYAESTLNFNLAGHVTNHATNFTGYLNTRAGYLF